jgi:site-specific DNA-cytosine methylase
VEINSALVSAQNRKRLYWTNIPFEMPEGQGILLKGVLESGSADRDKSYCLDANYYKGCSYEYYKKKCRRQMVLDADTWRMLYPVECERLQTLPDGYTEGVSNTQRYKMLGNGWTRDVISHIFEGIKQ